MPLTQKALKAIDTTKIRLLIGLNADVGGVTETTVCRWIRGNHKNLTRPEVLKVIREETGMSDSEILKGDHQPRTRVQS